MAEELRETRRYGYTDEHPPGPDDFPMDPASIRGRLDALMAEWDGMARSKERAASSVGANSRTAFMLRQRGRDIRALYALAGFK